MQLAFLTDRMTPGRQEFHHHLARRCVSTWPRSATWHHLRVAEDLESATARYRAAQRALSDAKALVHAERRRLEVARAALHESIIAQARDGARMGELVAETGLSREWIRTLLRAAGIEPD